MRSTKEFLIIFWSALRSAFPNVNLKFEDWILKSTMSAGLGTLQVFHNLSQRAGFSVTVKALAKKNDYNKL